MSKGRYSHRAKLLAARWRKDETGSVPAQLPLEFVQDLMAYQRMFDDGGITCIVHGLEHQDEMAARWPAQWMLWMFDWVGMFDPTED